MSDLAGPLAGLVLLLALSGFFSGAETALMAVSRYRLRYLERRGSRRAASVRRLIAKPDRLLSAILLGNNFVNVAAASVATTVALEIGGQRGVWAATVVMTGLILIFSEIAPKTVAARRPERIALLVSGPLRIVTWLLAPAAHAASAFANVIIRPIAPPNDHLPSVSEEEIQGMLELGEEQRVIAREKRRMLSNIFRMTETTIEDVMIPRTQIHAVSVADSPERIVRVIRESGATRVPVYRDGLDDVVGILHSKDVFRYWGRLDQLDISKLMRKPVYIPETATLETLLRLFRHHRQHLALVIDEFGGVEGLVSLEDLLEEIVGDIEDEHDTPRDPQLVELDDGAVMVEGTCPLSLLSRRYRLGLVSDESSTLAGFLMELSGDVPQPGARIVHGNLTFDIRRGSPNRVDLVRIEGIAGNAQDAEHGDGAATVRTDEPAP